MALHTGQDLPESDQHGSRREILIEPEHFWRNISTYSRFMAWRWEKVPGTSWVILLLCKNLLKGEIKAVWIIGVWPNMAVASQMHKRRRYWLTMYHTYLYLCLRTNQLCKVKRQLGKRPRRVAQQRAQIKSGSLWHTDFIFHTWDVHSISQATGWACNVAF